MVAPWGMASRAGAGGATYPHPFKGLYTVDAYGGITSQDSPPLAGTAYWPGWKNACPAKAQPGAPPPQARPGVDCLGGLPSFRAPPITQTRPRPPLPDWDNPP